MTDRRLPFAALALVLAVPVAAMLALSPTPMLGEAGTAAQNALHPIGFFALTLLALYATRPRGLGRDARAATVSRSEPGRIITVAVGAIAFALATEAAQTLVPGRTASAQDLSADLLGSAAALALWITYRGNASRTIRITGALVAMLCGGVALAPSLPQIAAQLTRPAWPVLEDGSGLFATRRAVGTYGAIARSDADRGGIVLQVGTGRWPGIRFVDMPADWRGCARLALDLTVAGDRPLTVMLRLHDDQHDRSNGDRFRRRLSLRAGYNEVRVAMDDIEHMDQTAPRRRMSLDRMAGLMLFATPNDAGRTLHIASVRLDGCDRSRR